MDPFDLFMLFSCSAASEIIRDRLWIVTDSRKKDGIITEKQRVFKIGGFFG